MGSTATDIREGIQAGSKELFNSEGALNKFLAAGAIAEQAMTRLIAKCVPGANVGELCVESDKFIVEKCKSAYAKDKGLRKGISFPTCVSINEILGHYSPVDETDTMVLKEGDMVKLDLGAHIGGFPAWLGTTIVCGNGEVSGRQADVIMAAWTAAEAATRSIKPGNSNYDVTKFLETAYEQFDCIGLQGVLTHECGKNLVDGANIIQNRDLPGERVCEFKFLEFQCFMVEVFASSGLGRPKETDYPVAIFKRDHDNFVAMKTPATRQFYANMMKNNPCFCFNIREEPDRRARTLGVKECLRHYVIQQFPVVTEAPGAFTAKFTFPLVILPSGPKRICVCPPDLARIKSDKVVSNSSLRELLDQPYPLPKASKKELSEDASRSALKADAAKKTTADVLTADPGSP